MNEFQTKLVEDNTPLVYHIAGKYIKGVITDDVIQCGMIGLIRSAKLFDPSLGFRFSTFAYKFILHEMWNEMYYALGKGMTARKSKGLNIPNHVSMDSVIGEDSTYSEILPDLENIESRVAATKTILKDIYSTLDEKEKYIFANKYLGMDDETIGKKFDTKRTTLSMQWSRIKTKVRKNFPHYECWEDFVH